MANNKEIAEQVLTKIGGVSNLKDATHCMTRLRLYLKDNSIPNDEEIKNIDGVLGVVRGGQQYQIIIGANVPKVYDELCKMTSLKKKDQIQDDEAVKTDASIMQKKESLTLKKIFKNILGYMAGCMTPLIPVLLAGGLFRSINSLCGPELLNLYAAESNLYILFDFLYDAAFYFMPILVGVNAAKQLGLSPMLGGYVGAILMVPGFAAFATSGEAFTVFGIPCTVTNYAQTVIPSMLSVFFLSIIYKLINKIMPDTLTTVFTPFLSMLISLPFILCLLAPLGTILGSYISNGLAWFGMNTGFLGVAFIAAIWQLLVLTGMHMALMMPMMASFFETGIQSGPMISGSFATWACFGVALGAALRLKDKKEKSAAFAAFTSGIVGGITEPTLYGICFRYTRCFVTSAIGAFVGGACGGILNVCAYSITSSNFLALLSFSGGTTANLLNGIISCAVSLVVGAVTTYLFGFSSKDLKRN